MEDGSALPVPLPEVPPTPPVEPVAEAVPVELVPPTVPEVPVVAPVLAVLMNMNSSGFATLLLAMALGTPILSLGGAIGAALTVGARRGGVLLSLLVLPLVTPVLIFGVGAVDAALMGLNPRPHLLILAGLLVGSGFLCPLAAAAG